MAQTQPPKAEINPKTFVEHGITRTDNYYWLNERENPKVREYLEAENAYMDQALAHTKPLQEQLYTEIRSRIKESDNSVPYQLRGYWYYTRYEQGKEYPIYCRKKGSMEAAEEVMLDVNVLAVGHDFYEVSGVNVSPNNNLLLYSVDTTGRRKYNIHFKNLATGETYAHSISNASGGAWALDNNTVFYTVIDDVTLRAYRIYRHNLSQSDKADFLVYEETDNTFYSYVTSTKSDDYIMIVSGSTMSSEVRFLDAKNPTGEFTFVQQRMKDVLYSVEQQGDKFYILHNKDAVNFMLSVTPIKTPGVDQWKTILNHDKSILREGFELFDNFIVVQERSNALNQFRIIDLKKNNEHMMKFDEEAFSARLSFNPDFATNKLRYSYTSMTTPYSTYEYDMVSRSKVLLKEQEVLGGYDKSLYETKRLWATASDGVKVPISIIYKKGIKLDGSNPALLYGYGSYGLSTDPGFSYANISLLDRGFVYAIAHIRGGEEMGREWYEEGKKLKKMNTFTDFIACGEFLIQKGYTSNNKLFARGGSAGGLLMGAVANLRPDLFKGILAHVPFVDVVTTMMDESIPLTTGEYDEWGNPNEPEYFKYMLSYSPYDNVKAQSYPAMLVYTAFEDSQVQYFEPAKWVAKLRVLKTDTNPLYIQTEMAGGHGGKSGRFERLRFTAIEFAFMFDLLGITE